MNKLNRWNMQKFVAPSPKRANRDGGMDQGGIEPETGGGGVGGGGSK